jgi:hypothetical protein
MTALYSRGETRDFIDIDLVVQSGRFTRERVLELGDSREVEPMDRLMLAARFRESSRHTERQFGRYGVDPGQRAQILERYAGWAASLEIGLRAPVESVADRDLGPGPERQ